MDDRLLFYLAGVPILGIAAQWIAWRLRLPSILLLLAFGVVLGQFINPDVLLQKLAGASDANSIGPRLLFPVVSLSVAVILFEGGLSLKLSELKHAGVGVFRLCTIGVLVSWVLGGFAAWYLLELAPSMAALIGAILVVTGPTVIAPLLRHIKPTRQVGSIAKWEGIVIDPVGAVLAVLVFQVIAAQGESSFVAMFAIVMKTVIAGCIFGLAAGYLLVQFVGRYWIPDFLQGVFFLTVTLAAFAVSNSFQSESGLVTVTLLGIYLANQRQVSLKHVVEFKEHLTVLLISCLFIVLGSRLNPKDLAELGFGGVAFLVTLILVVRPASVFLSMIRTDVNMRERCLLACLAPRGIVAAAVTSVFALEVAHLAHGHSDNLKLQALANDAEKLVPLTFLIIVGTVAVYGLLAGPLARQLKLAESNPQGILFAGAESWVRQIAAVLNGEGIRVLLVDTNYQNIAAARMEGLPAECASVLSEHVREEVDLGGIGRMLAMTGSDEVNALAVREFIHMFGRAEVYQLRPWDEGSGKRASVTEELRGRVLFGDGLHHDKLANMITHGFELKKTRLSDEFTYEQFRERYGESAILLFLIDDSKTLEVRSGDEEISPSPGQTVIALVDPTVQDQESERPTG